MEMHQVRYFLALARTLNFTRAAEDCNVSQPSLTRAIKLLETELGGELLRRERGLTHLTELGERMVPLLTQCHESAANAKAVASAMRTRQVALLRLALPHGIEASAFAPHLATLLANFPGLSLRILRGTAAETEERLRTGGAELAVVSPDIMGWDRFESWPLFHEPLVLALPLGHRLANVPAAAPSDLAGERVILRRHCESAGPVEALLAGAGLDPGLAIEVIAEDDLAALVAAGAGVAFVPLGTAIARSLRWVPVAATGLARDLRLYAVHGRLRGPATALLVTLLRSADWTRYAEPDARLRA